MKEPNQVKVWRIPFWFRRYLEVSFKSVLVPVKPKIWKILPDVSLRRLRVLNKDAKMVKKLERCWTSVISKCEQQLNNGEKIPDFISREYTVSLRSPIYACAICGKTLSMKDSKDYEQDAAQNPYVHVDYKKHLRQHPLWFRMYVLWVNRNLRTPLLRYDFGGRVPKLVYASQVSPLAISAEKIFLLPEQSDLFCASESII